jgi:hypothetical protein
MSDTGRPPSVRLRGHSYIAYALTPEWPITQWLGQLDESIDCFADFLVSKSIVLDLSKVTPSQSGVAHLIAELQTRRIHIMGLEGVGELGPELPPVLRGGRAAEPMEPFDTRGSKGRRSRHPLSWDQHRCCSTVRCVRVNQSCSGPAMSRSWAPSRPGPKLWPAAPSMCMAHCAVAPLPARPAIPAPGSSAER